MQRSHGRQSRRRFLSLATSVLGAIAVSCVGSPAPSNPPPAQLVPNTAGPTPTVESVLGLPPLPFIPPPSPTPEPIELRFAHWETEAAGAVLTTAANRFQQTAPRIVIQEDVLPFGAHIARLAADSASGSPPDVFVDSGAYFYDHLDQGVILDLAPLATASGFDLARFWADPTTRPANGQLHAVPLWSAVELIFANLDALNHAGAALPSSTWTWDDFLALAKKLTDGKPGEVKRWGTLVVNDLTGGWGSLVASNGGSWIDVSRSKTTLDAAAVEALQWAVDAIHLHHVGPDPTEQQRLTQAGQFDPFVRGDIPLLLNGTWEMSQALAQARFTWDVVPLPRAPRTGASVSVASAQPGCVAKKSAHPSEAWSFLRSLLGQEVQSMWTNGKVRLPSDRFIAADPASGYATAPPAHASIAATALTTARDFQFTRRWQKWRAAVVGALEPAFVGRILLADAIASAVAAGDTALGS